ncbi:MAG TPA: hypothetical protein VFX16_36170 [Pseudonocardiaceae bacterium]|nr:hypothetical protein [Pseudonocardiaceae bacterium]
MHRPGPNTPEQAASQLGHPLAVLAENSGPAPMIGYSYSSDRWPTLDDAELTYADPVVRVGTALIAIRELTPVEGAREALMNHRMNTGSQAPDDIEAWLDQLTNEIDSLVATSSQVTIDGTRYEVAFLDGGAYQVMAFEAGPVRVTVAGLRTAVPDLSLGWLRAQ